MDKERRKKNQPKNQEIAGDAQGLTFKWLYRLDIRGEFNEFPDFLCTGI